MMMKNIKRGHDLQISLSDGVVIVIKRAGEGQISVGIDAPQSIRISTQSTADSKTVE